MRTSAYTMLAVLLSLGSTACESGLERPEFTVAQSSPDPASGNGTIAMSGMLGGRELSIYDRASATLEYDQLADGTLALNDLEIWTWYEPYYLIGLELEDAERMLDRTGAFRVNKQFEVDVVGHLVGEEYGVGQISATRGTFTVTSFNNASLVASYSLVFRDGSTLSGEIDLTSFDARISPFRRTGE